MIVSMIVPYKNWQFVGARIALRRVPGAYKLPAEDLAGFSLLSAVVVASESLPEVLQWRRPSDQC